jgi:hypothetical protein
MAFDAPRKTLDDIRRELDAEFGETAAVHIAPERDASERAPAADDDAAVDSLPRSPADAPARPLREAPVVSFDGDDELETARHDAAVVRRARLEMQPRRRGGYIAAGVIGCLVGQLVLIGFMVVMRHRPVNAPSLEPPLERVGATPLGSTPTAPTSTSPTATAAETTSEGSAARVAAAPPTDSAQTTAVAPPATVAPPTNVAPPAAVAPATPAAPPTSAAALPEMPAASAAPAARSVPPASISIPPATPPASIASPAPVASDPKPVPRRVVKRAPTEPPPQAFVAPPPPPASPVRSSAQAFVGDSPNWAASQEEVRAALSQWLSASGRADQSIVSDTVVFLGADSRTARTHVPMRWGGKVVIREQRWVRRPGGWALVDDREAWQGR